MMPQRALTDTERMDFLESIILKGADNGGSLVAFNLYLNRLIDFYSHPTQNIKSNSVRGAIDNAIAKMEGREQTYWCDRCCQEMLPTPHTCNWIVV